jgi:pyruvate formate lyase activating enzyme
MRKTTLIDYPGRIAATAFTGNCNFRCPYCHNKELVLCHSNIPPIAESELLDFLRSRRRYIEGVVFTGGEPTMQEDLPRFLARVKEETGLLIKLDTNGTNPAMLRQLISRGVVDYVAMDIKSSPEKYCLASGVNVDMAKIRESASLLLEGKTGYEFRTTVVPDFYTEEDALAVASWLKGASLYALQQFVPSENCIDQDFSAKKPYPESRLEEFRNLISSSFGECIIRNV